MTKREKVKPYSLFDCSLCEAAKEQEPSDFKKHLSDAHSIEATVPKSRRLSLHLDGDGWWTSTYEWRLQDGSMLAIQVTGGPR